MIRTRFSILEQISALSLTELSKHSIQSRRQIRQLRKTIMAIPLNKFFIWRDTDRAVDESRRALQMAFSVSSLDGSKTKQIYMKRSYFDLFTQMKTRLETKVKDFLPQTSAGQAEKPRICPVFPNTDDNQTLEENINIYDLFFGERRCDALRIGKVTYTIVRDSVWLDRLDITVLPLVGCPIFPSCDWKNSGDGVEFHWFLTDVKVNKKQPPKIKIVDNVIASSSLCRLQLDGRWAYVGTGQCYTPIKADVGFWVAVVVDCGANGVAQVHVCDVPVQDPEESDQLIFGERQRKYCASALTGNLYRIVSYNILADLYLNLKKEQAELFFPHCPKEYQERKYRYPLILRELGAYNADLMFLQECDVRMKKRFLEPFLKFKGFTPVFNCKENEVNEGLMIAYRNDRFCQTGDNLSVRLSNLLQLPSNADLLEYVGRRKALKEVVMSKPTILQLVHLRTKEGLSMLAANTHLIFDPAHEEVKLVQTVLCLRHIVDTLSNLAVSPAQIIFAGDFNSLPSSRVVDIISGRPVVLNGEEDASSTGNAAPNVEISTRPFQFHCVSQFPEYTNFTKGFSGCLDYIWTCPPVQVQQVVPMPSHGLVTKFEALPSKIAPSDHLALICDIELSPPAFA